MTPERQALVRRYADGDISWQLLRRRIDDGYLGLLGSLAELGLRPPVAPAEDQERARSILKEVLGRGER